MNDEIQDPFDQSALSDYLEAHRASLVTTDGSYAVSVHGEVQVDGHAVAYHLIPDAGFLGKSGKWRRLSAQGKLELLRERWNDETCAKLEALLADTAREVLETAGRYGVDARRALSAFVAKYERASERVRLAQTRIREASADSKADEAAARTRAAVNLSRYPESFTVAQGMQRHFIAVLGPTNSGKTHAAMEHLAKAKSGVYLAPLRLLALENYQRLVDAGVPVSLVTGEQRKIDPDARHVASTVEMLNSNRPVEVAVIDEIQLLDDPDRGAAWTAAVCGVPAQTVYLLGALEARDAIESLVARVGGTLEVRELTRKTKLEMDKAPLGSLRNLMPGDVLIAFSRREVLAWRDRAIEEGHSVSAIYGSLSPEVRQAQAERFVEGHTSVVVATDAIGMGLNTPARRVIFTTDSKFDGVAEGLIPAPLARQIAGRAGRFGKHETGFVAGIDARTHKSIAQLLRQKPEPLPDTGFYVAPNLAYLQDISQATGETKLAALLELFTKHINVHDEFFLPANLSEQMEKARWLDALPLSLEDRFTLSLTPVSTRIPLLERALFDWAEARAKRRTATVLRMGEVAPGRNALQRLEDLCKLYAAYAWLAYRMADTFPDGEMAQVLMLKASDEIDAMLQQQNRRSRGKQGAKQGKPQGARRGGGAGGKPRGKRPPPRHG